MPNIIHYSPEALQDLDDIYDYILIVVQNPIGAQNTVTGIRKSIANLKSLDNIPSIRQRKRESEDLPFRRI